MATSRLEYHRAWRKANREKILARRRAWRKANLEKARAWQRAYRKANPEKVRAQRGAWRKANPEKARAQVMAWRKANLEKHLFNKSTTNLLRNFPKTSVQTRKEIVGCKTLVKLLKGEK